MTYTAMVYARWNQKTGKLRHDLPCTLSHQSNDNRCRQCHACTLRKDNVSCFLCLLSFQQPIKNADLPHILRRFLSLAHRPERAIGKKRAISDVTAVNKFLAVAAAIETLQAYCLQNIFELLAHRDRRCASSKHAIFSAHLPILFMLERPSFHLSRNAMSFSGSSIISTANRY